ncbi:hypothetical protein A1Q1_08011 [Trichosporon asahii var. asahii CBS 2479]|uniref:Uncharacterized protein n=1 Tax=Trichosporon asahii var. asahii (strain ATCC 90039 / CBS 2479 / JCM 2466 / KCTC 7840 / NBRC 103889/ NCYC 2677 / UAMH 7654) TaxID=1186058 RepID=J5R5F7_TRIAS|nr:hypothetical protein A1Q1_08011 [Trichosporon asahii var. asahii CBS 2479]EJT50798.1 hypothetical protein A1Q1_08011 [Trichosporon asahii var. asahii CBS 2479]
MAPVADQLSFPHGVPEPTGQRGCQQTNAMKLVFVPVSEPEEGHGHPDFDLSSHSKASLTMELALYLKATGPSPVRGLEPEH